MKNLIKFPICILLAAALFTACNDDDDGDGNYWYSYGTIVMSSGDAMGDYYIDLDNGSRLLISVNLVPNHKVEDGQRVTAYYTILGEADNSSSQRSYYVRLNGLYDILTKGIIEQSFIDEDYDKRIDSIANDPVYLSGSWFKDQYLNLEYEVIIGLKGSTHMLNLVWDNTSPSTDTAYLSFRHNSFGNVPTNGVPASYTWGRGVVSFDISDVLPAGQESIIVKLDWTEYGSTVNERRIKTDTGIFTLSDQARADHGYGIGYSSKTAITETGAISYQ